VKVSQLCKMIEDSIHGGKYHLQNEHYKQGDIVLKYALTCAVRGAILANKNSSIKLFYLDSCSRVGKDRRDGRDGVF
jgi:hypothetical protein